MRTYGFILSLVLGLLVLCGPGCGRHSKNDSTVSAEGNEQPELARDTMASRPSPGLTDEQLTFVNRIRPEVKAFCGDCHVMPRPTSSSREDWIAEIDQGFMLYETSGRKDLKVPSHEDVLKFFQYQAPEELTLPTSILGYPQTPIPFRRSVAGLPSNRPPGVTNVQWMDLGLKDFPALVYCNIGTGAVVAHWPQIGDGVTERLATLLQPVHAQPCDLDGDGLMDLVVADIGEFNANDSDLGRVVWLRRKPDSEKFETIVLSENLSRVADVQPGDFDGDGDLDLIVAVFGWRQSGRTILLDNQGAQPGQLPTFAEREIDERHGPSHVPPVDLNGDGHLDFVALISQDHEVIEAFINDGTGSFKNQVIYQAPDPAYGSSGIQLIDMDGDSDLDILYTNGDSFDRGAKPYHSIQWLENPGSYPYLHHHLCEMPGVLNAKAGDFDGDGDVDVVAASLLGSDAAALMAAEADRQLKSQDVASVVMLIQTSPGEFERTKVESQMHQHISLEPGDFNGDGKLDFAVGNFLREIPQSAPDLVIWWNES